MAMTLRRVSVPETLRSRVVDVLPAKAAI